MHAGVERAAPQSFLLTIKEIDEERDEERKSVCDGGDSMVLHVKVEIPEPIMGGLSTETGSRQQAVESSEEEEMQHGSTE